ncbi:MAG: toll/interleukin-1 receptor domain-containing protein [Chloroflexi bacterium]|nr:toll/interleukin-1 receptor domain-containing protein [Chloroflexota bacterium]
MLAPRRIFLSYAREDEQVVAEFYQQLCDAGYQPWMARKDILPGEKWKDAIALAVEQSAFFIACLSRHSLNKRGYIQKEIGDALEIFKLKLDSDIYIIPVRLEECELPRNLREFQYVDLYALDGWQKLERALEEGQRRMAPNGLPGVTLEKRPLPGKPAHKNTRSIADNPNEKRRHIQTIRKLIKTDSALGIRHFLELEERATKEGWSSSLRDELASVRAEFRNQGRIQQQVLVEAGNALTHLEQTHYRQILADFTEFFVPATSTFQSPLRQAFSILLQALEPGIAADETFLQRAHQAALEIWSKYDDDAREFLRPLLIGVYKSAKHPEMLLEQLGSKAPRLMRDELLQRAIKERSVASPLWVRNHRWREVVHDSDIDEEDPVGKWLELAHLTRNPFGHSEFGSDPLLLRAWVDPRNWNSLKMNRPMVVVASDARDARAVATRLLQQIRAQNLDQQLHRSTFPVRLSIPLAECAPNASDSAYLEQIARALSESWCELLAGDVDAYLELDRENQVAVAELLFWSSEKGKLASQLQQAGLPDSASSRMLLRRLQESIGSSRRLTKPTETHLHAWFGVRPKDTTRTFLLVNCESATTAVEAHPYELRLESLANRLWRNGIILKLFTTAHSTLPLETLPLEWDKTTLVTAIKNRIQAASEPGVEQCFADFFDPHEKSLNVEAILARCAKGALNRLLDIGNAVIQARVARGGITDENDFYLNRSDLLTALRRFNG